MQIRSRFLNPGALFLSACLAIGSGFLTTASAATTWSQNDNLASTLSFDGSSYTSDLASRTATTSFFSQVITNNGASVDHAGMYFAWMWSYNSQGAETPLSWDNATQSFKGGGVTMMVARLGGSTDSVRIGDVAGDTWAGVPWHPTGTATSIASDADWVVPLFDFGPLAAGAQASYDFKVTMVFDTDAAFEDWNRAGNFYLGAQGVSAQDEGTVPEPASLALVAAALAGLGIARRRRA